MNEQLQNNYLQLVQQLKKEIQSSRIKAALAVNVGLLQLYWKIGRSIAEREDIKGWGTKIVVELSKDLRSAFPDMKGFSVRNLRYMREFAKAYPQFFAEHTSETTPSQTNFAATAAKLSKESFPILQAPLAKLSSPSGLNDTPLIKSDFPILQQSLQNCPWFHICTILDKIKIEEERWFYTVKSVENNWSRNTLIHQIESKLYHRQGKAITNFEQTLPSPQSDLAMELMKDPYKFDFLNLYTEYKERDLENALTDNLTRFLLELGTGFSFVGRQYPIEAGDKDYNIDLLFYHIKLHCYVAIELKAGEFLPEYAGKLKFYLNVLDDTLKQPQDNASIGILICKERNKIVTEYALRGINKPIGVSEYQLTEALPDNLKGSLPTIEQIEMQLQEVAE